MFGARVSRSRECRADRSGILQGGEAIQQNSNMIRRGKEFWVGIMGNDGAPDISCLKQAECADVIILFVQETT